MFNNSVKRTSTLLCTLLLALVFVGTSCKKDEETSKDKLTAHDWKLVSSTLGGASVDIEDCDFDDYITYHDDGELHLDEGLTKCEDTDPQEIMGTWSISDKTDPETLTLDYDEDGAPVVEEYDITEITNARLVLTIEIPFFGTLVNTFEKV